MKAFTSAEEILANTTLVERFLDYVTWDTQSDEESSSSPSTETQLVFGRYLVEELRGLGLEGASIDEHGYVRAEYPGSAQGVLGLCAHMDTAPAFSGTDVRPVVHEGYDGSVIRLGNDVCIDPEENPELTECLGDTLITADGTTLLGADDKAGIAEILALVEVLQARPELVHPTLRLCFTPDEEIGSGAAHYPLEDFGAPVAFTVDGGFAGDMSLETFSADKARITFTGVSVHPGSAKGKLVNALTYLGKFLARLPMAESPECTEGREGFYHPVQVAGDAAECRLDLILRDFDSRVLAERGERLRAMAASLVAEEPKLTVEVELIEQYRNMHDELAKHPEIGRRLARAIELAGVEPRPEPVRGGTDGSQLTAMGMPTPNVFTGGGNFHGPREWISTRVMGLATCTLLNLVQLHAGDEV